MARYDAMTRFFFSLAAGVLLMGSVRADVPIWAGLFAGENGPAGRQAPPGLTGQLRAVFGYRHYRMLKGDNFDLRNNAAHWTVGRPDFFMRIDSIPHGPDEPDRIGYEIFKDGFPIARGRYVPQPGTPLFINGPDFGRGQLIFVVETR